MAFKTENKPQPELTEQHQEAADAAGYDKTQSGVEEYGDNKDEDTFEGRENRDLEDKPDDYEESYDDFEDEDLEYDLDDDDEDEPEEDTTDYDSATDDNKAEEQETGEAVDSKPPVVSKENKESEVKVNKSAPDEAGKTSTQRPDSRPRDYTDDWGGHAQDQGLNLAEEVIMLRMYNEVIDSMSDGSVRVEDADPPTMAKTIRNWVYSEFRRFVRRMPLRTDIQHQAFLACLFRRSLKSLEEGTLGDYSANPKAAADIRELVDTRYVNYKLKEDE